MKNITRKTKNSTNVLSIVDNERFKTSQANQANNNLFSHKMRANLFQFQIGDTIICRPFMNEKLSPNAMVINETENGKHLTTVANAVKIVAVVVAFKREVSQ